MDAGDPVPWQSGWWLNRPPRVGLRGESMLVTAERGSDAWRTTSYGFVRDGAHALLVDLDAGSAIEVSFLLDFDERYDQAGVMVRQDDRTWIKAGVEISDGQPQASAVATREVSDWSAAPVPGWRESEVTVRASRTGDAVTIRIRRGTDPWRLLRLAPVDPDARLGAGPYCAAPERAGLSVTFTGFRRGPADAALHAD